MHCKRRSRPIAAGMEEQLAILCDKALQAFGAKLCQRLVGALAIDQAAGVGDEDLKAQGISSSMRDCGWPSAIASSVAFIQA